MTGKPIWIELFTGDTDTAETFYGGLFGWTASRSDDAQYGGYIVFERDGAPIAGLMRNDGSQGAPDAWTVYLESDDVARTAEKVQAAGGQLAFEPMQVGPMGHMAGVIDPAGAYVGVWQPLQHRGISAFAEVNAPTWFETHSRDYAASVAFYQQAFDWDIHVAGDTDEFRYSTFGKDDDAKAGIMDGSGFLPEGVPSHWTFYVEVADADATLEHAKKLGGALVEGPDDTPYGRLATVADPSGQTFKVMQRNRRTD